MPSFRPKTILRKKTPVSNLTGVSKRSAQAKCTNEVREYPVTKSVTHPAPGFSSRFEKEK